MMCKIIKGERKEEEVKYRLKRSKGIIQILNRLDFCETLVVPDDFIDWLGYQEDYGLFNLRIEAKILDAKNNSLNFIDYWRGQITVIDDKDKTRVKNLLLPLKDLYVHNGWDEITDEKLTFKCNSCRDNYLKINSEGNLIFSSSLENLNSCSFKSADWVIEEMKRVINDYYL